MKTVHKYFEPHLAQAVPRPGAIMHSCSLVNVDASSSNLRWQSHRHIQLGSACHLGDAFCRIPEFEVLELVKLEPVQCAMAIAYRRAITQSAVSVQPQTEATRTHRPHVLRKDHMRKAVAADFQSPKDSALKTALGSPP